MPDELSIDELLDLETDEERTHRLKVGEASQPVAMTTDPVAPATQSKLRLVSSC